MGGEEGENESDGQGETDWEEVADEIEYRHLEREEAQYAWNRYVPNREGVPKSPRHHVLVFADYAGSGTPTEEDRRRFEGALEGLEDAFAWSNEGVLFTVSYSPRYFERFDESLPEEVDLPEPTALSGFETPELDRYEVVIHLASDYAQAVLSAEELLFGGRVPDRPELEKNLDGLLVRRDRRTGFVGEGLPAEHQDIDGSGFDSVPREAPLFMGFHTKNGVEENHPFHGETEDPIVHNQRSEAGVAIEEGPFAGGTTQQISRIDLDLEGWYGVGTADDRIKKMFTPSDDRSNIGEFGEGAKEGAPFQQREIEADAETHGAVGHAEKLAQARREDNIPLILRRDFNTVDGGVHGVHFVSLQKEISDFVRTRVAMNGAEFRQYEGIGEKDNNGILEFLEVRRRGNYLVPPRGLRSLPPARPE